MSHVSVHLNFKLGNPHWRTACRALTVPINPKFNILVNRHKRQWGICSFSTRGIRMIWRQPQDFTNVILFFSGGFSTVQQTAKLGDRWLTSQDTCLFANKFKAAAAASFRHYVYSLTVSFETKTTDVLTFESSPEQPLYSLLLISSKHRKTSAKG